MRTHLKFIRETVGFSLRNIKRLEVKFDPYHPNAVSIREFYQGATSKKILKTNKEIITKATIVSDLSDPLVTVEFADSHKLVLNGKYLESNHIVKLIKRFEEHHKDVSEGV